MRQIIYGNTNMVHTNGLDHMASIFKMQTPNNLWSDKYVAISNIA
jgi:hypothetical protein